MSLIAPAYREIIDIAVVTLIVSGIILMFSRIQGSEATVSWAIVLGIKIALATMDVLHRLAATTHVIRGDSPGRHRV